MPSNSNEAQLLIGGVVGVRNKRKATPSMDYWEARAVERRLYLEQLQNHYNGRITHANKQASNAITDEIRVLLDNFALRSASTREEAQEILNGKIRQDELQRLSNMARHRGDTEAAAKYWQMAKFPQYKARLTRLESLKDTINYQLEEAAKYNIGTLTECLENGANESYLRTIFDFQKGTGIAYSFDNLPNYSIQALIESKWAGKGFSESIWNNTHAMARQLQDEITQVVLAGKSIFRCKEEIAKYAQEKPDYVAERILRTEANYVENEAQAKATEASGFKKYMFIAHLDSRTSSICQGLDLKIFKVSERKVGINYPPMHPNCRSTTATVVTGSSLEDLERRARDPKTDEEYIIPADMNYAEWKETIKAVGAKYQTQADKQAALAGYTQNARKRQKIREELANDPLMHGSGEIPKIAADSASYSRQRLSNRMMPMSSQEQADFLKKMFNDEETRSKIKREQLRKHVYGTAEHKAYNESYMFRDEFNQPSVFLGSFSEKQIQELVSSGVGQGVMKKDRQGVVSEQVQFDDFVGFWYDNVIEKMIPTKRIAIRYGSTKRRYHAFPIKPKGSK